MAEDGEEHNTYVSHTRSGWYWWCDVEDHYPSRRRYDSEAEAIEAAAEHERQPG